MNTEQTSKNIFMYNIKGACIEKILISNKSSCGKNGLKYFIDYKSKIYATLYLAFKYDQIYKRF